MIAKIRVGNPTYSQNIEGEGFLTFSITKEQNYAVRQQVMQLRNNKKALELTLDFMTKQRSLDANSYFHLLVDKIAKSLNKSAEEVKVQMVFDYGTLATDEKGLKAGFKALKEIPITQFFKYAKPIGECIENGKTFIKYLIYKETHTLNTKEMSILIDGTVQEAKQLGIETLTPMELAMLKGIKEAK